MERGADNARFTATITIGKRIDEAIKRISCISSMPCALVDVNVRAPAAEEPQHADIAECSDSTLI